MKTYIFFNSGITGVEITITEYNLIDAVLLLKSLLKSLPWIKFESNYDWEVKETF